MQIRPLRLLYGLHERGQQLARQGIERDEPPGTVGLIQIQEVHEQLLNRSDRPHQKTNYHFKVSHNPFRTTPDANFPHRNDEISNKEAEATTATASFFRSSKKYQATIYLAFDRGWLTRVSSTGRLGPNGSPSHYFAFIAGGRFESKAWFYSKTFLTPGFFCHH